MASLKFFPCDFLKRLKETVRVVRQGNRYPVRDPMLVTPGHSTVEQYSYNRMFCTHKYI